MSKAENVYLKFLTADNSDGENDLQIEEEDQLRYFRDYPYFRLEKASLRTTTTTHLTYSMKNSEACGTVRTNRKRVPKSLPLDKSMQRGDIQTINAPDAVRSMIYCGGVLYSHLRDKQTDSFRSYKCVTARCDIVRSKEVYKPLKSGWSPSPVDTYNFREVINELPASCVVIGYLMEMEFVEREWDDRKDSKPPKSHSLASPPAPAPPFEIRETTGFSVWRGGTFLQHSETQDPSTLVDAVADQKARLKDIVALTTPDPHGASVRGRAPQTGIKSLREGAPRR
ncbi:hypothetical protein EVAR_50513_1 [Eumeta japonica]|uniref:Uncharacterized protein n=1 Tax=Eumeta variegata TaxID=151549 RepID=A0A4C1X541_EUMVA|nr:hypothetical protein EVAR_50513_1 [Eumeta japonica]